MFKIEARLNYIKDRKAALAEEIKPETTEERLNEIKKEADELNAEADKLLSSVALMRSLNGGNTSGAPTVIASHAAPENANAVQERADAFRASGVLSMPLFVDDRSLLVSSGKIAMPTAVSTTIGELPSEVCTIVDDVEIIDATGTGSWEFPYKKTDAVAADVTEGNAIGGTGATFDKVTIAPSQWGVLDTISNQVTRMTNVNYTAAVQNAGYRALRVKARDKIVTAVLASSLLETRKGIALDAGFLRNLLLNYGAEDTVAGDVKLYINRADLITLGAVRGTNEKRPLYDIRFTDTRNGIITEGGMSVPFSVCSTLTTGQQLFGNPRTIKLLLWGDYEIKTDEGGKYFETNTMAVRALATAGAGLTVYHGMQLIKQSAS